MITLTVRDEVRAYNAKPPGERFFGLVQPTDTEQELNGYLLRRPRRDDRITDPEILSQLPR